MTKDQEALLRLFNGVFVSDKLPHKTGRGTAVLSRTISNGYVLDDSIQVTGALLKSIEQVIGIGGEKMNAAFHKSWNKVANASGAQLVIEQMVHYMTTYGFEQMGIYNPKFVYIPREQLDIPDVDIDTIQLMVIRGMDAQDVLNAIVELGSSGIALSQSTLDGIMDILRAANYPLDFVSEINNRELLALLYDFYNIAPSEPEEYLRFVILKLTGESLVIKNNKMIAAIKKADAKVLDGLLTSAPENLASIFYRYKPLFLAMKSISRNKTFFNRLRKDAVALHEPIYADALATVTSDIKRGAFQLKKLAKDLPKYSVWRKIRLMYALQNRLVLDGSIVYKVRNGKAWVTGYDKGNIDLAQVADALLTTMQAVGDDLRPKVDGKVFYIPEGIHYTVPATQKQMVGNIPANSFVEVGGDLIVGVHWYNGANRVDIDLSLIDFNGKFGWDGDYRSGSKDILFSGDITDAPLPNGATELFYMNKGVTNPKLIHANYYTYDKDYPVDCQLVVASKKAKFNGRQRTGAYVINPSNIIISQQVKVDKQSNMVGMVMAEEGKN